MNGHAKNLRELLRAHNHSRDIRNDSDSAVSTTKITIHMCVPDDQEHHLPKRRRAPHFVPSDVPLPRVGEVIYLSTNSVWAVQMVIHRWRAVDTLHIEVWLEHLGRAKDVRPSGFALTQ